MSEGDSFKEEAARLGPTYQRNLEVVAPEEDVGWMNSGSAVTLAWWAGPTLVS